MSSEPSNTDKRQGAQNNTQPTSIVASDSLKSGVLQRQGQTWVRGRSGMASESEQGHSQSQAPTPVRGNARRGSSILRGNLTAQPLRGVPQARGTPFVLRGTSSRRGRGGLFAAVQRQQALEGKGSQPTFSVPTTNNRFALLEPGAGEPGVPEALAVPTPPAVPENPNRSEVAAVPEVSGPNAPAGPKTPDDPEAPSSEAPEEPPAWTSNANTSGTMDTSMAATDDDQPEFTIEQILVETKTLGGKIDLARRADTGMYDYFQKDYRRRSMTFLSELRKLEEEYKFGVGDDSENVELMIKLFHYVAKQYENAGLDLKQDLLYEKLSTTSVIQLSLAAVLPLVKQPRTGSEAYFDDGLIDFCVDIGATQRRNVFYATHHTRVSIRADEVGKYKRVVCRHHQGQHWFLVSFILPTKSDSLGSIEIRDSSKQPTSKVPPALKQELEDAAKTITAHLMETCVWAPARYEAQVLQPNAVDCGTLTTNGAICQLLGKDIYCGGLSEKQFCQSLRTTYLRWAYKALVGEDPVSDNQEDDEMCEYVKQPDGSLRKVTDAYKARNHLDVTRRALAKLSTHRKALENRTTNPSPHQYTMKNILTEVLDAEEARLRLGLPRPDGPSVDDCMRFFPDHANPRDSWYSETMVDSSIKNLGKPQLGTYYAPVVDVVDWLAGTTRLASAIENEVKSDREKDKGMVILPAMPSETKVLVFAVIHRDHWTSVRAYRTGKIELYNSVLNPAPYLEVRICQFVRLAFARVNARPSFTAVNVGSPQQTDAASCGPITVNNCLELLMGRKLTPAILHSSDILSTRLYHLRAFTILKPPAEEQPGDKVPPAEVQPEDEVPPAAENHVDGNRILRYMRVDYRELMCNALQTQGDLTSGELSDDVNAQLVVLLGVDSYDTDDSLTSRIETFLKTTPVMFAYSEDTALWSLRPEPWRSLSSSTRRRLVDSRLFDSPMEDLIDTDFDFGIVFDRHSWKRTPKKDRPTELKDAFHARFSPTTQDYTEIKSHTDYKRKTWYLKLLNGVASTVPPMVSIHQDLELTAIMTRLNEQEDGADVFWLQSGFDGSSDAIDYFEQVVRSWPNVRIKVVIVSELAHRGKQHKFRRSLARGAGWIDHEHSALAGTDSYSLMWTVLDMRRLVSVICDRESDIIYNRALHLMLTSHCAKLDYSSFATSEVILFNPNFRSTIGHRSSFGVGVLTQRCYCCGVTVPFAERWVRGPRTIGEMEQCAMYRLACGRPECEQKDGSEPV